MSLSSLDLIQFAVTPAVCLLVIMATAGNALIGIFLLRTTEDNSHKRDAYLASISMADFFMCAAVFPFTILYELSKTWRAGRILCGMWKFLDLSLCAVIIYTMAVICTDICVCLKCTVASVHRITYTKACLLIRIIWTAGLLGSGVVYAFVLTSAKVKELDRPFPLADCIFSENMYSATIVTTLFFLVPLLWCINVFIQVMIRLHTYKNNGIDYNRKCANGKELFSFIKTIPDLKRDTLIWGIKFFIFFVCWCPFFSVKMTTSFCEGRCVSSTIRSLVLWLPYVSSWVNPFVCGILHRRVRTRLKQLCSCCSFRKKHGKETTLPLPIADTNDDDCSKSITSVNSLKRSESKTSLDPPSEPVFLTLENCSGVKQYSTSEDHEVLPTESWHDGAERCMPLPFLLYPPYLAGAHAAHAKMAPVALQKMSSIPGAPAIYTLLENCHVGNIPSNRLEVQGIDMNLKQEEERRLQQWEKLSPVQGNFQEILDCRRARRADLLNPPDISANRTFADLALKKQHSEKPRNVYFSRSAIMLNLSSVPTVRHGSSSSQSLQTLGTSSASFTASQCSPPDQPQRGQTKDFLQQLENRYMDEVNETHSVPMGRRYDPRKGIFQKSASPSDHERRLTNCPISRFSEDNCEEDCLVNSENVEQMHEIYNAGLSICDIPSYVEAEPAKYWFRGGTGGSVSQSSVSSEQPSEGIDTRSSGSNGEANSVYVSTITFGPIIPAENRCEKEQKQARIFILSNSAKSTSRELMPCSLQGGCAEQFSKPLATITEESLEEVSNLTVSSVKGDALAEKAMSWDPEHNGNRMTSSISKITDNACTSREQTSNSIQMELQEQHVFAAKHLENMDGKRGTKNGPHDAASERRPDEQADVQENADCSMESLQLTTGSNAAPEERPQMAERSKPHPHKNPFGHPESANKRRESSRPKHSRKQSQRKTSLSLNPRLSGSLTQLTDDSNEQSLTEMKLATDPHSADESQIPVSAQTYTERLSQTVCTSSGSGTRISLPEQGTVLTEPDKKGSTDHHPDLSLADERKQKQTSSEILGNKSKDESDARDSLRGYEERKRMESPPLIKDQSDGSNASQKFSLQEQSSSSTGGDSISSMGESVLSFFGAVTSFDRKYQSEERSDDTLRAKSKQKLDTCRSLSGLDESLSFKLDEKTGPKIGPKTGPEEPTRNLESRHVTQPNNRVLDQKQGVSQVTSQKRSTTAQKTPDISGENFAGTKNSVLTQESLDVMEKHGQSFPAEDRRHTLTEIKLFAKDKIASTAKCTETVFSLKEDTASTETLSFEQYGSVKSCIKTQMDDSEASTDSSVTKLIQFFEDRTESEFSSLKMTATPPRVKRLKKKSKSAFQALHAKVSESSSNECVEKHLSQAAKTAHRSPPKRKKIKQSKGRNRRVSDPMPTQSSTCERDHGHTNHAVGVEKSSKSCQTDLALMAEFQARSALQKDREALQRTSLFTNTLTAGDCISPGPRTDKNPLPFCRYCQYTSGLTKVDYPYQGSTVDKQRSGSTAQHDNGAQCCQKQLVTGTSLHGESHSSMKHSIRNDFIRHQNPGPSADNLSLQTQGLAFSPCEGNGGNNRVKKERSKDLENDANILENIKSLVTFFSTGNVHDKKSESHVLEKKFESPMTVHDHSGERGSPPYRTSGLSCSPAGLLQSVTRPTSLRKASNRSPSSEHSHSHINCSETCSPPKVGTSLTTIPENTVSQIRGLFTEKNSSAHEQVQKSPERNRHTMQRNTNVEHHGGQNPFLFAPSAKQTGSNNELKPQKFGTSLSTNKYNTLSQKKTPFHRGFSQSKTSTIAQNKLPFGSNPPKAEAANSVGQRLAKPDLISTTNSKGSGRSPTDEICFESGGRRAGLGTSTMDSDQLRSTLVSSTASKSLSNSEGQSLEQSQRVAGSVINKALIRKWEIISGSDMSSVSSRGSRTSDQTVTRFDVDITKRPDGHTIQKGKLGSSRRGAGTYSITDSSISLSGKIATRSKMKTSSVEAGNNRRQGPKKKRGLSGGLGGYGKLLQAILDAGIKSLEHSESESFTECIDMNTSDDDKDSDATLELGAAYGMMTAPKVGSQQKRVGAGDLACSISEVLRTPASVQPTSSLMHVSSTDNENDDGTSCNNFCGSHAAQSRHSVEKGNQDTAKTRTVESVNRSRHIQWESTSTESTVSNAFESHPEGILASILTQQRQQYLLQDTKAELSKPSRPGSSMAAVVTLPPRPRGNRDSTEFAAKSAAAATAAAVEEDEDMSSNAWQRRRKEDPALDSTAQGRRHHRPPHYRWM